MAERPSGGGELSGAAEAAAIFDAVLDPARSERTISPAQIEADGGLGVEETRLIMLNCGLRAPEAQEPYFTAAEAEVFVRLGSMREVWPPELYLQVVRVYGQALAHIARTEVNLFRLYVEPNLRSASADLPGREAVQETFGQLLSLSDPMLLGVHRRRVEHELTQAVVREAEIMTPEGVLPGAIDVTFLFCDLKDFSAYADAHGDAAAADVIERLGVVVAGELGHYGHVVKALGDGFMLSYPEPGEAVAACVRIIEQMREGEAPGIHAGIHRGVVLYREGDYFGSAVNLAARLVGLAGRDELLASEAVVRATVDRFAWESRGPQGIRGFGEPVSVYRLLSAATH